MNDDKSEIISEIAEFLINKNINSAKELLLNEYPHKLFNTDNRTYTTKQKIEQFINDGFIDRYSGEKLLNPGILKVLSFYLFIFLSFYFPMRISFSFSLENDKYSYCL